MPYVAPLQYRAYDRGPSWGQSASRALVLGLQKIQQSNDENDAFENKVAAAGGTLNASESPERARLNALINKFHRRPKILGGSGGGPSDDEIADAERNVSAPIPVAQTTTFDETPTANPPAQSVASPIIRTGKIADMIGAGLGQNVPTPATATARATTPAPGDNLSGARDGTMQGTASPVRGSRIAALMQQTAQGVHPYTVKGPHGMSATIDPTYGSRVASLGKMQDYEFERAAQQDEQDASNEEKIQALVNAGMPEDQARAKVLNNVVSYDETFGRARPGGGLTFDQRVQLEDIKTRRAQLIEGMKTARKRNDPVAIARIQQEDRRLQLEQERIEVSIGGLDLKNNAEPTGVAGVVAGSTPEGQAAAEGRRQHRATVIEGLKDMTKPKSYSTDSRIRRAQELWDNNPAIQRVRKRPQ